MSVVQDLMKIFFPFGWGIFCFVGTIGYLALPDTPRWIAASAWFISMIISFAFVIHIWRYHRSNKPSNYLVLPEVNQTHVSIKLIIAIVMVLVTFVMSIVFWASNKPEEYGMLNISSFKIYQSQFKLQSKILNNSRAKNEI